MNRSVSSWGRGRGALGTTALACILAVLAGCGPNRSASERGPAAVGEGGGREGVAVVVDTLRGTLAIVGSEPLTEVVLRPAAGGTEVVLQGDAVPELRRVAGLEVWVAGSDAGPAAASAAVAAPGARAFRVERFEVRAADGVPAVDGILVVVDDVAYLRVAGGAEHRIAHLPAALRGKVGARIWLSGRLDGNIEAFGVIREAGS